MSLLMEALRKAEAAKKKAEEKADGAKGPDAAAESPTKQPSAEALNVPTETAQIDGAETAQELDVKAAPNDKPLQQHSQEDVFSLDSDFKQPEIPSQTTNQSIDLEDLFSPSETKPVAEAESAFNNIDFDLEAADEGIGQQQTPDSIEFDLALEPSPQEEPSVGNEPTTDQEAATNEYSAPIDTPSVNEIEFSSDLFSAENGSEETGEELELSPEDEAEPDLNSAFPDDVLDEAAAELIQARSESEALAAAAQETDAEESSEGRSFSETSALGFDNAEKFDTSAPDDPPQEIPTLTPEVPPESLGSLDQVTNSAEGVNFDLSSINENGIGNHVENDDIPTLQVETVDFEGFNSAAQATEETQAIVEQMPTQPETESLSKAANNLPESEIEFELELDKKEPIKPVPPAIPGLDAIVEEEVVQEQAQEQAQEKEPGPLEKEQRQKLSARSIFASKKKGKKPSRKVITIASGIAALLVLTLGGGYYYLTALSGDSGLGFQIDSSVANQSFPSPVDADSDFSAEAAANENTQSNNPIETIAGLDAGNTSPAPVSAVFASDDAIDAMNTGNQQLPIESNTLASGADAAANNLGNASDLSSVENPGLDQNNADSRPAFAGENESSAETVASTASTSESTNVNSSTDTSGVNEPPSPDSSIASEGAAQEIADLAPENVSAATDSDAPATEADVAVVTAPVAAISFRKKEPEVEISPKIERAYSSYQRGVYSVARQLYSEVLAESPYHRDALLGLASIAAANQETLIAVQYYDQILSRDPNDVVARAARLELVPSNTPAAQERELNRLREMNPDAPSLAYALGNHYAEQQNWRSAQEAYFDALRLAKGRNSRGGGSVNPDYAFNLAVSLEHLNQGPSARTYYQEALDLAGRHFASFDLEALRQRLATYDWSRR